MKSNTLIIIIIIKHLELFLIFKDLERIIFSLSTLNYNPHTVPCIFETVIKELRSDSKNFEMHIKSYFRVVSYLAVMGIFPYDCITKTLQIENLHKCFGECKNYRAQ